MAADRPDGRAGIDVAGYLDRLGVAAPGPPSAAALYRLHTAHVERVPFEMLWIALGRPRTVDPAESVDRIVAGYGGFCFQLNPAFAALLQALGYRVTTSPPRTGGCPPTRTRRSSGW